MAFFKQKTVEGANSKDLGMPIMENNTLRLGDFVLWKAFHPSSAQILAVYCIIYIYIGTGRTLRTSKSGYLSLSKTSALCPVVRLGRK